MLGPSEQTPGELGWGYTAGLGLGRFPGLCSDVEGHEAVKCSSYCQGHGGAVQQSVRDTSLQMDWNAIWRLRQGQRKRTVKHKSYRHSFILSACSAGNIIQGSEKEKTDIRERQRRHEHIACQIRKNASFSLRLCGAMLVKLADTLPENRLFVHCNIELWHV